MSRRTLAGDLALVRTATYYALCVLWGKIKAWADGAVTLAVATAVVLLPSALLFYALFR